MNCNRKEVTDKEEEKINSTITDAVEIYYSETASNGNIISKDINEFKTSVAENAGYYIWRYEARTTKERTASNNTLIQITNRGTDQLYNFVTQGQIHLNH